MRRLGASIAASLAFHASAGAWLQSAAALTEPEVGRAAPLRASLLAEATVRSASIARARRDAPAARASGFAPPIYYTASQVDLKATPIDMKMGIQTPDNFPLGRMATVKLRLLINEEGAVDAYQILEADGLPIAARLDDVREIRFRPAERAGRAVKSQKVVEISFIP
ncbi:MAG: hypothetical protein ABR570_07265 [Burkholderiales bacterium]